MTNLSYFMEKENELFGRPNTLLVPLPRIIQHSGGLPIMVFMLQIALQQSTQVAVMSVLGAGIYNNVDIFPLWTPKYLQIAMYVILS